MFALHDPKGLADTHTFGRSSCQQANSLLELVEVSCPQ